jgi:hypothetical protein
VSAELIYRRGTPPDAEYTFKHALVQDAAYDSLQRSRRQQLHARITATLEGRFPEIVAAQPVLLAHHCTAAGLPEQAIAYWLTAGRQALARSAAAEAAALLRRGLALVPTLPDGDRRREAELDLQIALGQALIASHANWGVPELAAVYSRARELASVLNRPRALVSTLWNQWWDDLGKEIHINVVGFEEVGILAETDCLQPIPHRAHAANSSSKAFASYRTGVPKPSVNQP